VVLGLHDVVEVILRLLPVFDRGACVRHGLCQIRPGLRRLLATRRQLSLSALVIKKDFLFESGVYGHSAIVARRGPKSHFDFFLLLKVFIFVLGRLHENVLDLEVFLSNRRLVKGVYSLRFVVEVESVEGREPLAIRSATTVRYSGKLTTAAPAREHDALDRFKAPFHLSRRAQTPHTLLLLWQKVCPAQSTRLRLPRD